MLLNSPISIFLFQSIIPAVQGIFLVLHWCFIYIIVYVKITIYLTYTIKKICGSLNLEMVFSMNYDVIDMSSIVLWVSVCVRNINVKDFTLAAFSI